jgi:polysaccharide export outer membrane protein
MREALLRRWTWWGFVQLAVIAGSLLFSSAGWAVDSLEETNPGELESSAKYNYYLGQYYYNQNNYDQAEQYFQRSRDLIQQKSEVVSSREDMNRISPAVAGGTRGGDYLVGEGDVLYVSVWENNDLNQEVIVRPDGKISYPLVGDVPAAGRSIPEIDDDMTKRLKEFIKFPDVSISIRKLGGAKVIVLGEVGRPGVYAVSGAKTVIEAIALAGGFTSDAVATSIVLIRHAFSAKPEVKRLDLARSLYGVNTSAGTELQSEDIIYVPKTFISNVSRIMSMILDPVQRGAMTFDQIAKMT